MATPLLLYKFNEASSGTTPTNVLDSSSGTALNMAITYGTSSWATIGAGRGLNFSGTCIAISAALNGTKVATALAGITGATLEAVADTTSYTGFNTIFGLQDAGGTNDIFVMLTGSAGVNQVGVGGAGGTAAWFDVTPGLHHFMAVQDNTQATAANRLKLYVDGVLASVNASPFAPTYPTLSQAIDAGFTNYANNRIGAGGLVSAGNESFVGPIYFAAVYASALTSGDATAHSTALLANNDADPNVGGALPFAPGNDSAAFSRLIALRYQDLSAVPLPTVQKKYAWITDPAVVLTKAPKPPLRQVDDPLRPMAAAPLVKWAHDIGTASARPIPRFYDPTALTLPAIVTTPTGPTPLVQYLFKEAASGTAPTAILDTAPGPAVNATITYGASAQWTAIGAGDGLNYAGTGSAISASLTGGKVQTGLSGATKATVEVVIDSAGSTATYDSYLEVVDGSTAHVVSLTVNHGAGGLLFSAGEGASPNDCLIKYAIPTSGVLVIHVVIDTTQAVAANRVLVYVNGASVTPTIIDQIGLNVVLDQGFNWSTATLTLGAIGAQPNGKDYYATIYTSALSPAQVASAATFLAANNDAAPSGGGTVTAYAPAQDISTFMRPPAQRQRSVMDPMRPIAIPAPAGWSPDPSPRVNPQVQLRMPRNSGGIPSIIPWLQDVAPATVPRVSVRAESALPLASAAAPPPVLAWAGVLAPLSSPRTPMRADATALVGPPIAAAPASLAWASDGQPVQRQPQVVRSSAQVPAAMPGLAAVFRGVLDNPVVRWFRSKFQPASAEVLAPLIPVIIPPFEPGPLDISPVDVVLTIWEANV